MLYYILFSYYINIIINLIINYIVIYYWINLLKTGEMTCLISSHSSVTDIIPLIFVRVIFGFSLLWSGSFQGVYLSSSREELIKDVFGISLIYLPWRSEIILSSINCTLQIIFYHLCSSIWLLYKNFSILSL